MGDYYSANYSGSKYGKTLEEFINNTVLIKGIVEVHQYIQLFLWKTNTSLSVESKSVLESIMGCDSLLCKTQIVTLLSWRNGVLQVRPRGIAYDTGEATLWEVLEGFKQSNNPLFLYLHEKDIYPFLHPMFACQSEEQNILYFQERRKNWKVDYENFKKKVVDELLDYYNQFNTQYKIMKDEAYLIRAKEVLNSLQQL